MSFATLKKNSKNSLQKLQSEVEKINNPQNNNQKNFGEDDPLNDFVRKLFNEGTEESIKMAKSLMARQRFFSPVLVRGEEDKGVRIWGYGKMVYEQLLNLVLNPEYGDITDTETGTDLVLHYGKPQGASFPQTKLTPRRRSSLLCDEAVGGDDRCAELLENIPTMGHEKNPDDSFKPGRKLWDPVREKRRTEAVTPDHLIF